MSPLVQRTVTDDVEATFGKPKGEHVLYVPRSQMKRGDVVVEPTPKQLAELAEKYPDEYGAKAAEAGVAPGGADPMVELATRFAAAKAGEAVEIVEALDEDADIETLAVLYEVERERAKPRSTVLAALAAKGFDGDGGAGDEDEE